MAMNLPLSRMSLQEKLVAMELLWADLSATPDQVVSPAWHGEELQRRREQLQQGSAKFLNWDDAIAELKTERQSPGLGNTDTAGQLLRVLFLDGDGHISAQPHYVPASKS